MYLAERNTVVYKTERMDIISVNSINSTGFNRVEKERFDSYILIEG